MKLTKEFKIGLMSIVAIVALIFGYNYLKGKNLLENTRTFYAIYDQVEGLSQSSPVSINGLQIGTVTKIQILPDTRLLVTMNINNDFPFSKTSVAEIYGGGLLGGKTIAILPDTKNKIPAKSGDTLTGKIETGLLELVNDQLSPLQNKVESAITGVDTLVKSFNYILDEKTNTKIKNSIDNFTISMNELSSISSQINQLLSDNKEELNETFSNFNEISLKFNTIADSVSQIEFGKLINEFEVTLNDFKSISSKIKSGEGNLGKLVYDEQLYTNLENATKQLEELFLDMKLNPKRYVHFSVFGKKNKEYVKPSEEDK